jgi:hypothetical protein
MDGNSIDNASYITGEGLNINSINVNNAPEISFYGQLKSMAGATITNLPAPTNDGDVANKLYVDDTALTAENNAKAYADSLAPNYDAAGSAATAESNANDYTDDAIAQEVTDRNAAIAATRFNQSIAPADWSFNAVENTYYVYVTHNLNSEFPLVLIYGDNNQQIEMVNLADTPNTTLLISNISVSGYTFVTIAK